MIKKYTMQFKNIKPLLPPAERYETWRKGNQWYSLLTDQDVYILSLSQENDGLIRRFGVVERCGVNVKEFIDITYDDLKRKGYSSFAEVIAEMKLMYENFDPETDCISMVRMELL